MTGAGAPFFAAADWGTTRLRIWLMDERGNLLAERRSDEGMAAAASAGFPAILEKHLAAMGASATLPAVICGMAGARQGWIEAPYVPVPAALDAVVGHAVAAPHDGRMVRIIPGLAQTIGGAPDVMRGEETQLLGAVGNLTSELQLVCLPGTHSKWAEVEAGTVKRFSTWMTGELFSLLSTASILRHAVDADLAVSPDDPAFLEWLDHGLGHSGDLTSLLFRIRAAGLLQNLASAEATAALSGLLIGNEIVSASSRFGGGEVMLIGSGALGELYARALQFAGFGVARANAEDAVRAGLFRAAGRILAGVEGKAAQ